MSAINTFTDFANKRAYAVTRFSGIFATLLRPYEAFFVFVVVVVCLFVCFFLSFSFFLSITVSQVERNCDWNAGGNCHNRWCVCSCNYTRDHGIYTIQLLLKSIVIAYRVMLNAYSGCLWSANW